MGTQALCPRAPASPRRLTACGLEEFIAALVDALAWPAGIAFVTFMLRHQLAALLEGPVKRWRGSPVEVEYWETAAEVAEAVVLAQLPTSLEMDEEVQRAATLAEQIPVVAVGKAYGLVERRLREIAAASGGEPPANVTTSVLAAGLHQRILISAESESAIRGLGVLRSMAAHDDGCGRSVTVERDPRLCAPRAGRAPCAECSATPERQRRP